MEASALKRSPLLPCSRRLLAACSDERLVKEAQRGSEVAFEVIYDRYHRQLLTFCRHMLGSREDAEDASNTPSARPSAPCRATSTRPSSRHGSTRSRATARSRC